MAIHETVDAGIPVPVILVVMGVAVCASSSCIIFPLEVPKNTLLDVFGETVTLLTVPENAAMVIGVKVFPV
jgi:hypothetical protein